MNTSQYFLQVERLNDKLSAWRLLAALLLVSTAFFACLFYIASKNVDKVSAQLIDCAETAQMLVNEGE